MKGRILGETPHLPKWITLEASEQVLFCGQTETRVRNPVLDRESMVETAVLTDRRLICLARMPRGSTGVVTTIPLHAVQAIQTTDIRWDWVAVVTCIVAFIFYIVPGVIFLIWMNRNTGPRVNVASGNLRAEVRFFPDEAALLRKLLVPLEAEVSRQRQPA